jgi:hypothetical protein
MKNRIVAFFMLFLPTGLLAQNSLTWLNNSLRVCDSNTYREIQFSDPGNSGSGQIWDFSKIQDADKSVVSTIQCAELPKMSGINDYGLTLDENGYEYFMSSTDKELIEQGYINPEQKLVLSYSDPIIKMKYPFSYGDHFTDHFSGVAWYGGTSAIDMVGDISVVADGAGRLILPDKVYEDALRVKSVKKGLQVNICGTNDFTITKYSWYAPGYRYPVLSLNIIENRPNGGTPVITRSASTNTQQFSVKSATVGSVNTQSKTASSVGEMADVSVVVSPNPFTEKLKYEYLLPGQMNVSIELYDVSGQTNRMLVTNQLQNPGLHNGEFLTSGYGLTAGVYFMRFTFDKQIVISKVVKL